MDISENGNDVRTNNGAPQFDNNEPSYEYDRAKFESDAAQFDNDVAQFDNNASNYVSFENDPSQVDRIESQTYDAPSQGNNVTPQVYRFAAHVRNVGPRVGTFAPQIRNVGPRVNFIRSRASIAPQVSDFLRKRRAEGANPPAPFQTYAEPSHEVFEPAHVSPPAPKRPRLDVSKNPISLLNEIRKGAEFTVVSTNGPSHQPTFVIQVVVGGQVFLGEGGSKQAAKAAAAEAALAALIPSTEPSQPPAPSVPNPPTPSGPFGPPGLQVQPSVEPVYDDRNPIMILNERDPGVVYRLAQEVGDSQSKKFLMEATVSDGRKFYGSGKNKKIAKTRVAKTALEVAYNYVFPTAKGSEAVEPDELTPGPRIITSALADHISELVEDKYNQLVSRLPERFSKFKVLAGIVMVTNDDNLDSAQVVTVTTGTKCAGGESMSLVGGALNDCHAEILARRGLQSFLYQQLLHVPLSDTVFESCTNEEERGQRYRLKPNVSFHLYISTAPCGDGRIFSSLDDSQDDTDSDQSEAGSAGGANSENEDPDLSVNVGVGQKPDRHPNRLARGLLRVKIESGEGTIPVKTRGMVLQTWDGIVAGERLLTMSCSDKLARWNVLGVQGSLLSNYLSEPIYLSSIVVASVYHSEHLTRAVYGRLQTTLATDNLPPGYRLNKPSLCTVSSPGTRRVGGKSPGHAGMWVLGDQGMELIDASTGVVEEETETPGATKKIPRLSKREMFKYFTNVWATCGPPLIDGEPVEEAPKFYADAKRLAEKHQRAKVEMCAAFAQADLGKWVKRPMEHDQFHL